MENLSQGAACRSYPIGRYSWNIIFRNIAYFFQLMLPEAVAIVCAPKFEETGFFVLTPNYGLDYIANCTLTGMLSSSLDPKCFLFTLLQFDFGSPCTKQRNFSRCPCIFVLPEVTGKMSLNSTLTASVPC